MGWLGWLMAHLMFATAGHSRGGRAGARTRHGPPPKRLLRETSNNDAELVDIVKWRIPCTAQKRSLTAMVTVITEIFSNRGYSY